MRIENRLGFASVGCNRVSQAIAWGPHGVLSFAAGPLVALYDPEMCCVFSLLRGHTDRVNSVAWVLDASQGYEQANHLIPRALVSGSSDRTVRVWRPCCENTESGDIITWSSTQIIQDHASVVTFVTTRLLPDGNVLLATCGSDGNVYLYCCAVGEDNFSLIQTLSFGNRMMECADFGISLLSNQSGEFELFFALGGIDRCIHLYFYSRGTCTFIPCGKLAGHEDWIRCVHFAELPIENQNRRFLLASASQDCRIRIWNVCNESLEKSSVNLLETSEIPLTPTTWVACLETVIAGHEQWVYGLRWHPSLRIPRPTSTPIVPESLFDVIPSEDESDAEKSSTDLEGLRTSDIQLLLLSVSMDRSMILWAPDASCGLWMERAQMGQFGGLSGVFGHMGYFGAEFSPDGSAVLAHSYNGSFHMWKLLADGSWSREIVVSGHQGAVTDVVWHPTNDLFLSVSEDQTCRIFCPCPNIGSSAIDLEQERFSQWGVKNVYDCSMNQLRFEMNRPQIHGYDMRCAAFLSSTTFSSGGDEKVIRVFDMPSTFAVSYKNLTGLDIPGAEYTSDVVGASVPPLGLTNKPVRERDLESLSSNSFHDSGESGNEFDAPVLGIDASAMNQPPLEDHLLQSTLWPERVKLYGLPDDVISIACSPDGMYLAGSCKAKTSDMACIRVWNSTTWLEVACLRGHNSSPVELKFSHSGRYLLSVSKDRQLCVFRNDNGQFSLVHRLDSSHSRIIWSADWSHDDAVVGTASREGKFAIRRCCFDDDALDSNALPLICKSADCKRSITSLAFAPSFLPFSCDMYGMSLGFENGDIELWSGTKEDDHWIPLHAFSNNFCHQGFVHRLRWSPLPWESSCCSPLQTSSDDQSSVEERNRVSLRLLSCGADHSIREHHIHFLPS